MDSNQIDPQVQKELNTPLKTQEAVNPEDQAFLELIVKLVNEGKINLYSPSSLLNDEVYNKLDNVQKGKTDIEAQNMLTAIRNIKGLYDAGYKDTYQIFYQVSELRLTKERLEYHGGDLFII
ncbi:MAG: hypothetical protein AAB373_06100 [Patescibacteria group bacterium]